MVNVFKRANPVNAMADPSKDEAVIIDVHTPAEFLSAILTALTTFPWIVYIGT